MALRLTIKFLSGDGVAPQFDVSIPPNTTVEGLKQTMTVRVGLPLDEIRLVHGGQSWEDNSATIGTFNLPPGALVHLIRTQPGYLGEGMSSEVVLRDLPGAGVVACKTARSPEYNFLLENEAKLMRSFDHPCIMKLVSCSFNPQGRFQLMMPPYEGNLGEVEQTWQEAQVLHWVRCGLRAVQYLHTQGICHRDVKPSNYLVDQTGKEMILTDFSVTRRVPKSGLMRTRCGTRRFLAPEVVLAGSPGYTMSVDIWSTGLTFKDTWRKACMSPLTHQYEALFNLMLDRDPLLRPPASEMLRLLDAQESSPVQLNLRGYIPQPPPPRATASTAKAPAPGPPPPPPPPKARSAALALRVSRGAQEGHAECAKPKPEDSVGKLPTLLGLQQQAVLVKEPETWGLDNQQQPESRSRFESFFCNVFTGFSIMFTDALDMLQGKPLAEL